MGKNNKKTLIKFTNAINKALKFVKENDEKTIANVILPQFPDISKNMLSTIIKRYKDADSWLTNPYITEDSFENLEDIMINADILEEYVPYKDLINNLYEK